nr:unnamed protein product [Digitaria exilis]
MVCAFVADEAAFARSVEVQFAALDANGDGFDCAEFRDEMRRIMLAVAEGQLGSQPLQAAIDDEDGSFLLEAVEHEAAAIVSKVDADRK